MSNDFPIGYKVCNEGKIYQICEELSHYCCLGCCFSSDPTSMIRTRLCKRRDILKQDISCCNRKDGKRIIFKEINTTIPFSFDVYLGTLVPSLVLMSNVIFKNKKGDVKMQEREKLETMKKENEEIMKKVESNNKIISELQKTIESKINKYVDYAGRIFDLKHFDDCNEEESDRYFYVDGDGTIEDTIFDSDDNNDMLNFKTGNMFYNVESIRKEIEKRKIHTFIRNFAISRNGTKDYRKLVGRARESVAYDGQYIIDYNLNTDDFEVSRSQYVCCTDNIFFNCEGDAKQCLWELKSIFPLESMLFAFGVVKE